MSPTTSAAATTSAFGKAAQTANILHFPVGENLSTKEAAALLSLEELKADHPAFVETAERLYPTSVKGQTQYMMQVIAQAEAIASREAEGNIDQSLLRQAQQTAFDYSNDHKRTAATQESHGVGGMFSTAFAHIPASSPYRPK